MTSRLSAIWANRPLVDTFWEGVVIIASSFAPIFAAAVASNATAESSLESNDVQTNVLGKFFDYFASGEVSLFALSLIGSFFYVVFTGDWPARGFLKGLFTFVLIIVIVIVCSIIGQNPGFEADLSHNILFYLAIIYGITVTIYLTVSYQRRSYDGDGIFDDIGGTGAERLIAEAKRRRGND